jgi:hypothetical protein|tara:strand:+ start:370 stop:729 length:360 start_codon:yes stop_codon:yes gene_type:complete
MAILTLQFYYPLNVSVSVGDTAYYVPTTTSAGFNVNSSDIVEIGTILTVDFPSKTITVDTPLGSGVVTISHFILFSKDNAASLSSLLGYYAEVKMTNTNNSTDATELYQVGVDIFESSK